MDKKANFFSNEINLSLEQVTKNAVDFAVLYSFQLSMIVSKSI